MWPRLLKCGEFQFHKQEFEETQGRLHGKFPQYPSEINQEANFLLTRACCVIHLTYFGIVRTALYVNNQSFLSPTSKKYRAKLTNSLTQDCFPSPSVFYFYKHRKRGLWDAYPCNKCICSQKSLLSTKAKLMFLRLNWTMDPYWKIPKYYLILTSAHL